MNSDIKEFLDEFRRGDVLVVTGAGCSTESGIPDYRDDEGRWKRPQPMQWQAFRDSAGARQRYWARSALGWPQMAMARPGAAHRALAVLEAQGLFRWLVTQNVDGLHQQAGSRRVTDLHGRLDVVRCLACGRREERWRYQERLLECNAGWADRRSLVGPDGDAEPASGALDGFVVPECRHCGGVVKPDVVFFGENVPRPRVDATFRRLAESRLLLVVGSSLMVWSGYRFVRLAASLGVPVAIVNRGRTRGDAAARWRFQGECGPVLTEMLEMAGMDGVSHVP
jgi:NAD-dependent SIR2 family protein deacetylase